MEKTVVNSEKRVIDALTGLYNKEAFEEEVNNYCKSETDNDLTVVSMNINGLKYFNDFYGLIEGDEIVKAAALCAAEAYGQCGKVFRVGGDSFIALLDSSYSGDAIDDLKYMISEWQGNNDKTLSVAAGMVSSSEAPGLSLNKLIRVAYGRMMGNKAEYYVRFKIRKGDDNSFPYWIYRENQL